MKNMTWISLAALCGIAFYIILMIIEIFHHPESIFGAIFGSILLGLLAGAFLYKNEHKLHSIEMILLWAMIFLFIGYGALRYIGVIV